MCRMFIVISMLVFSFVASPIWSQSKIGSDWQEVTYTGTQNRTIRAHDIQITNIVEKGTACPGIGQLAVDTNGALLTCQSGRWADATPDRGRYICSVDSKDFIGRDDICGFSLVDSPDPLKYAEGESSTLARKNNSEKTQWYMFTGKSSKKHKNKKTNFKCNVSGYLDDKWIAGNSLYSTYIDIPSFGSAPEKHPSCSVIFPVPPGSTGKFLLTDSFGDHLFYVFE